jgi:hypothetical protein
MPKDFIGINVGTNQFDMSRFPHIHQFLPTEIQLKEDGSKTDGPSFCIVMQQAKDSTVCAVLGQISLEMLNDGLADIGYEIVKKT